MSYDIVHALRLVGRRAVTALQKEPVYRRLLEGQPKEAEIALLLEQIAAYVRESAPLLTTTADELDRKGRYPEIATLLRQKAREEDGHHHWAKADRRSLRGRRVGPWKNGLSPAVELYHAWFWASIRRGDALSFLGGAYLLEYLGKRLGGPVAAQLERRSATRRATSFFKEHGSQDVRHLRELERALAAIVDEDDARTVVLSAEVTGVFYQGLVRCSATPRRRRR